MRRRFVVLDRDGTLIVERHYLADPGGVELISGAAAALRDLSAMGLGLVLLTNQSGVGRGLFDAACLARIHQRLTRLLEAEGVRLDGLYVCPHTPEDGCGCRKPKPGLLERAARELGFEPRESFVIGDKTSDLELGRRIGAVTILVRTGYGAETDATNATPADFVVADLAAAIPVIRALLSRRRSAGAAAARSRWT
jgi:D-glycero-D-manno-heptose 1,7-bisphosphate phosphatase